MTHAFRRSAGFTIIELSLVLVVLGILAVVLVPMTEVVHDSAMRKTDEDRMEVIKDALLGYIRTTEGIPCVDAGGTDVSTGCDAANTLDRLGVRSNDSRNKAFVFDVNDTLTENEIAVSGNSICTALANIIDPAVPPAAPPEPNLCAQNNANTGNAACAGTNEMAFVLVGRGSDRCFNLENTHAGTVNDAVCPDAVAANRTFENPARNHSRTTDDGYYDDLVVTVTPSELAELLECPAGGGGGTGFTYCPAGEKLAQMSNGDNSAMSFGIGASCYVISEGTTASMGCQPETTSIVVHKNQSCGGALFTNTLANLDTNNDGRADIVCDDANPPNCTWR